MLLPKQSGSRSLSSALEMDRPAVIEWNVQLTWQISTKACIYIVVIYDVVLYMVAIVVISSLCPNTIVKKALVSIGEKERLKKNTKKNAVAALVLMIENERGRLSNTRWI